MSKATAAISCCRLCCAMEGFEGVGIGRLVMLLNGLVRAAACAVLAFELVLAGASGQQVGAVRGSGELQSGAAPFATIDMDGLSAAPRFARGQGMPDEAPGDAGMRSQNLVLVPLPAPVWAATSGLTSLLLIAAWRRHRLRSE